MSKAKLQQREDGAGFFRRHGVLAAAVIALIVLACLLFLLWFVVFSGMSASADFLYAQF